MPYFDDLNTYLHQSSLLIQAYPTSRITTKYSLPKKPKPGKVSAATDDSTTNTTSTSTTAASSTTQKREPAATLTLKTYHPESGICLKYETDKAQEVGRLMNGMGRLAKGEIIEMPSIAASAAVSAAVATTSDGVDKMDVDSVGAPTVKVEDKTVTAAPSVTQGNAGGGGTGGSGKNKKKKGKK